MIGIYKITEKENPTMFYVGKSNDIERRFKEHIQKSYTQSRIPFDDYISEKGKDAFTYEVLEECSLEEFYLKSCPLRFINTFGVGTNESIIPILTEKTISNSEYCINYLDDLSLYEVLIRYQHTHFKIYMQYFAVTMKLLEE